MFDANFLKNNRAQRRGNVLFLSLVSMVPLLGMVAFAIDWGVICVTKAELQRAADAAAMAGVWELVDARSPESSISPRDAAIQARLAVAEYAGMNTALGKSLAVENADIQVGYVSDPLAGDSTLDTSDPSQFNAVRVRLRRDASSRNGAVPLFFARVFGRESADTQAVATAVYIANVKGFEAPVDGTSLPLLPFALDVETWDRAAAGVGPDDWMWDPRQKKFVQGSDGIPEVNLYPQDTGSTANRGTVNIGISANSTSHIRRQIHEGVSAADLDYHGGKLQFNENHELYLDGDPGISAGFKEDLSDIRGQPRAVPIFRDVSGNGDNGVYQIIEWAGIRIADVHLKGGQKRVIVQSAKVTTGGTIPGDDEQTSRYVFSRVWISH